jgi:hypothetical protein
MHAVNMSTIKGLDFTHAYRRSAARSMGYIENLAARTPASGETKKSAVLKAARA